MTVYGFRLYICKGSLSSQQAESRLKAMLEERLKGQYTLEIFDILKDTDKAETDKILASPTLLKTHPPPQRRIIGDLSDPDLVMDILISRDDTG